MKVTRIVTDDKARTGDNRLCPRQRFLLSHGKLVRYEHPLTVAGLAAFRRSIVRIGVQAPGTGRSARVKLPGCASGLAGGRIRFPRGPRVHVRGWLGG
jgi:hypothetical protein